MSQPLSENASFVLFCAIQSEIMRCFKTKIYMKGDKVHLVQKFSTKSRKTLIRKRRKNLNWIIIKISSMVSRERLGVPPSQYRTSSLIDRTMREYRIRQKASPAVCFTNIDNYIDFFKSTNFKYFWQHMEEILKKLLYLKNRAKEI